MLKVKGDSMFNAGIYDKDIIVVEKTEFAKNGDIVVALINQDETTVKRFFKENNRIRLQPENDAFSPIYPEDISILGVVKTLIRNDIS